MNTEYVDGTRTKEQFDKLRDMLNSVETKAKDPNVKKITITFPRFKIPSRKRRFYE